MAFATIQITQGAIIGGSGESVLGLDTTTVITLTDDGGPGATSYLWEILSFPATDASAPSITNDTSQVATITPAPSLTDGTYLVRLTRDDPGDGVSTDVRWFAVEDDDGLSLPSPGVNRNNSNVGGALAAQEAGWFGSTAGSTNVLLDAFLRLRKTREGKFVGKSTTVTHNSGSLTTDVYAYDVDNPFVALTMDPAGTGNYQFDLDTTGAEDGAVFRILLTFNALAGDFILRNGSGGTTILTLPAPPSGSIQYEVTARFDGTNWVLKQLDLVESLAIRRFQDFPIVQGVQSTSEGTFTRAGTLRLNPSLYPANAQATFEAHFDTTDAGNDAEVQLYNLTDTAVVAGSTFSTTSTTTDVQSATVTLPSTQKDYEVQVRLTSADPAERATVTHARLTLTWA